MTETRTTHVLENDALARKLRMKRVRFMSTRTSMETRTINKTDMRSPGTLLPRVRSPPPIPLLDRGPESLRSSCCGQAIYPNTKPILQLKAVQ
ncbi:hypothetical protein PoB_004331500 [Plakobranchus ocellatus]|uniref:Uncharacterized protein n=1 Tax=Plakobranchus ocellatus TaxID=259542 RepID=A0AAV4B899_9GAST|nr:hypothetical protein PoB_004331500 [Plakobranchus ocellatus]